MYKTITVVALITALRVGDVMAIEEARYEVIVSDGQFEVRDYEAHIVAETTVEASQKRAGNVAFRKLFKYISGKNRPRSTTATAGGQKIAMTSPVGQWRDDERWVVSFLMPSQFTMQELPIPDDASITLRNVPARRMAAIRYSGGWSEASYREHRESLEAWLNEQALTPAGEAEWARYDPPFKPTFLRRNEVLIPIADQEDR